MSNDIGEAGFPREQNELLQEVFGNVLGTTGPTRADHVNDRTLEDNSCPVNKCTPLQPLIRDMPGCGSELKPH